MIIQLHKQTTGLSHLLEIPISFFDKLEDASIFDDNLFPVWYDNIFGTTKTNKNSLHSKFENLYNKYKGITDKAKRDQIVKAFKDGVQIQNLCSRAIGIEAIPIDNFPEVNEELQSALMHLWNNSLTYKKFEQNKAKTSKKKYVKDFIDSHHFHICPFCGLEGYTYLDGQSAPALDHWLSKTDFPYSSVNFDNLIPIGDKCNESPAKGTKNVLSLTAGSRVFYPFTTHYGIKVEIKCTDVPKKPGIEDEVYQIEVNPSNVSDQDLFDSWDALFNIQENYKSFLMEVLLNNWKNKYLDFIKRNEMLEVANNIDELIYNLKHWKGSFHLSSHPGSLIYRAFVENLLIMPKPFLYGLCEHFKKS